MSDNEQILVAALRAMAAGETRGPSPFLEQKLLKAMQPRSLRWAVPAGLIALAAALTVAVVLRPRTEKLAIPAPPPISPPALKIAASKPDIQLPTAVQHVSAMRKRKPLRVATASAAKEREQDPFIRIPYSATLEPTDRAELVRVSVPAAQLLSWGFPVSGTEPNFRIDADVLVGGDGLARAVRFIRTGATK